ncbi:hypothetical protein EW146_g810 [Bondarzewia mesenterica]|uniref:Fe2OG dioxygenase domain-containing protein n=1 Tax=Bondarzewia mesenterica TaxID=1095465 RepID=A0A4V3XGA0_9AGAM|nr:hypothetical protein EW146_g810 [Bondarzewia mesenterica]
MSLVQAAQNADTTFRDIPIIDLQNTTNLRSNTALQKALADQVRDACINVGFFYVKNHGIAEATISSALSLTKSFFSLPIENKMKLDFIKTPNFKGYNAVLTSNNDPYNNGDMHEGFEFGWESLRVDPFKSANDPKLPNQGAMAGANVWPKDVPGFREAVLRYYHAAVLLGKELFPLFALALNLPMDFFDNKTKNSAAIMRMLHYPPQTGPVDDRVIGIEPGIQALQVLSADKKWIDAPPIPGTLVINLGDQFARWTNDVFRSTVHRAMNRSGVHRYSVPLFFGTDYDVRLESIPSCVNEDRPPRYEVVVAGDYVKERLKATYGH